jgi:hypothetical protein
MKAPGPITIASRRSRSSAVLTYNRVRSGRLVARALGCSVLGPGDQLECSLNARVVQ